MPVATSGLSVPTDATMVRDCVGGAIRETTYLSAVRFLRGDEDDRRQRRGAEPIEIEGTPGAPRV